MIETKFKQTEVGLIPEDWECKNISELCSVNTGSRNTQDKVSNGLFPFYVRSNEIERINTYSYDCEAVLTAGDGVGTGKVFHYVNGKFEVHQRVYIINKFREDIDGKFFYLFFSNNFLERVNSMTAKSSVDSVRKEMITEMFISIPPLKEQKRIAAALTSIDNLTTSLSALIEKKKLIKQGTMQQLLTAKRRLPDFYEPWVEKKLGDICEFGNGYTPSKEVPSFWTNGTIPWFRMEDIRINGRILTDSIQHVTKIAVKGELFPSNSIIISTTATIGEHALLIVDSLANQRFTNLKIRKSLSQQIDIMWFFFYCYILGDWCRNNINEGGLAAVNILDFSNVAIYMPTQLSEQTAIANVLTSMDNEIASLEAKRAKYETIKQGMMQQLLTGKIRLI